MKKIFTFLFVLFASDLFGQFHPLENYPTPNVSNLGDFGKIPVNMYSGIPIISIPLYELKEADLSLPISLNYNLASVKPNNHPSWVGLGWSLSSGGYIARNVRGVYDEKKTEKDEMGFYYHSSELQQVDSPTELGMYKDNYMGDNNAPAFELMSDEYSFNFGPYSGYFYLNEHSEWVVVSDDEIKVVFDENTGFRNLNSLRKEIDKTRWLNKTSNQQFFDKFTLVAPDGVKYIFGGQYATEYSIDYYNRNNKDLIPTTWHLTEIQSPKGNSIKLEYEAGSPICEIKFAAYSSYIYQDWEYSGGKFLNPGDYMSYINNTYGYNKLSGYLLFPVYLKKITASFADIEFHSTETKQEPPIFEGFLAWSAQSPYYPRTFFDPFTLSYEPAGQFAVFMPSSYRDPKEMVSILRWRTLDSISIKSPLPKKFSFSYQYYQRKKLMSVTETAEGHNNSTDRTYRFTYNEKETFPRYVFASVDHWGYYNGCTEATQKGERSFSIPYTFDENFYNSRNATYNIDIAQAETLKEIIYPTGGKTLFSYQQNRYSKTISPNRNETLRNEIGIGGGLCVEKISHYDQTGKSVQTKKYYYTDDIPTNSSTVYTSSGILNAQKDYVMYYNFKNGVYAIASEGGFNSVSTNQTEPCVGYSSVIEETLNEDGRSTGFVRYKYSNWDEDLWGEKHADQNYSYAWNISGYTYASPISSRSMERGKILSEEYFNENKQLIKKTEYKYLRINEESIKMPWQEAIVIDNVGTYAYFSFMNYVYTHRYMLSEKIETEYNQSKHPALTKKQNYVYNKQKQLISVEIIQSDMEKYKTEYKYPTDFVQTPPYDLMVSRNIISPVIEQSVKKNNIAIKSELKEYKLWNGRTFAPQYIRLWNGTQKNQETRMTFHEYDYWGNPRTFSKNETEVTTILWEYDKKYPVIEIKNKTMQEIENELTGEALGLFYDIQFEEPMTEEEICTLGKLLRENLADALVTTYTYIPSIGMTSMTDPRGVTTYYTYDAFGRLQESYIMEDGVKKTVERYDYHYSNQ